MWVMQSRKYLHVLSIIGIAAMVLLLAACGGATGTPAAAPTAMVEEPTSVALPTVPPAPDEEGYPAPGVVEPTVNPYPAEGEAALPPTATPLGGYPPSGEETFMEPRFRIDQPLATGATTVTGQAPPNVAIAVLDVTFNGALLGSGRSDADGRFTIPVSPLEEGHRIGITVGELEPGQSLTQMAEKYFPHRGEGFMNLPNVGIFFDTAQVQS